MNQNNNDIDAICQSPVLDEAAKLIDHHQPEILNYWVDSVIGDIPSAKSKSRPELGDHLQNLLEDIVKALGIVSKKPDTPLVALFLKEEMQQSSSQHGRERATMHGYTVDHVVHEYIILRHNLTRFCREQGINDPAVLDIIVHVIDAASLSAVREFNRSVRAVQQKLIGTLVHDVRTPLGVAHNYAELMSRTDMNQKSRSEALHTITRNLDRASAMLEDLLDSVRSEAPDGLFMRFEKGDLNAALRIACTEADQLYGEKRIQGKVPEHPVTGVFDMALVIRTVENLISNAVKFGDKRSPVEVILEDMEDHVRVCVHNHGPPIPAENVKEIFDFFSTFPRGDQPVKSWGLGLSLIRTIADSHGGEIIIQSSADQGTTVGMTLLKHYQEDGRELSVLI